MNAGVGWVLTGTNAMNATMEPPDANMKIVERDPTNRYVRVFITKCKLHHSYDISIESNWIVNGMWNSCGL